MISPDEIEDLNTTMTQVGWWNSMTEWLKWARLYGGGVAVMLIDGQKVNTPLDPKTIGKDQFKGFYVFDRWQSRSLVFQGPARRLRIAGAQPRTSVERPQGSKLTLR